MCSIAIVGERGTNGPRMARGLVVVGSDVVGLSRGKGEGMAGTRWRQADLAVESAARDAQDGIQALYFTPPESGLDPLAQECTVGMNVFAAAIGEALEGVTGQTVCYKEAPGTRRAFEADPISVLHEELYAARFSYFTPGTYVGDRLPVTEAADRSAYGITIEDFIHHEWFAVAGVLAPGGTPPPNQEIGSVP